MNYLSVVLSAAALWFFLTEKPFKGKNAISLGLAFLTLAWAVQVIWITDKILTIPTT